MPTCPGPVPVSCDEDGLLAEYCCYSGRRADYPALPGRLIIPCIAAAGIVTPLGPRAIGAPLYGTDIPTITVVVLPTCHARTYQQFPPWRRCMAGIPTHITANVTVYHHFCFQGVPIDIHWRSALGHPNWKRRKLFLPMSSPESFPQRGIGRGPLPPNLDTWPFALPLALPPQAPLSSRSSGAASSTDHYHAGPASPVDAQDFVSVSSSSPDTNASSSDTSAPRAAQSNGNSAPTQGAASSTAHGLGTLHAGCSLWSSQAVLSLPSALLFVPGPGFAPPPPCA